MCPNIIESVLFAFCCRFPKPKFQCYNASGLGVACTHSVSALQEENSGIMRGTLILYRLQANMPILPFGEKKNHFPILE
jgi:hypothetical protein